MVLKPIVVPSTFDDGDWTRSTEREVAVSP